MCEDEGFEYLIALCDNVEEKHGYVTVGVNGGTGFLAGILEDILQRVDMRDCVFLAGIASQTTLQRMFENKGEKDASNEN